MGSALGLGQNGQGAGGFRQRRSRLGVPYRPRLSFQTVIVCNGLAALFGQTAFQDAPVEAGALAVWLLGENLDYVNDGKPPCVGGFVVDPADWLFSKRAVWLGIINWKHAKCLLAFRS